MSKKLSLFVIILTALALTGSALALAPMGPPTAGLKTGQFRAGADYSYSNMDFKIDLGRREIKAKGVKVNLIAANIGYGITDDLEGFMRLGVGNTAGDTHDFGSANGDYRLAGGLGIKYTFLQQENLDWGALFQIGWLKSEFSNSGVVTGAGGYSWGQTYDLHARSIEIALGPTWKAAEDLSIYGGPFLNFVQGSINHDYSQSNGLNPRNESFDLKQTSKLGGYVGAQWGFMQNTSLFVEFQYVGTGWTFGTGVGWKF